MAANKNVTLRDVAKRAGVSIATVSRVLNGTRFVSDEIRDSVHKAIKELGYYQNSIARSLKTNATMTIGLVTADISNPYIITVAKAVEDIVQAQRYNLLVCSTNADPAREEEYLKLLMGRNIDGLVLNGTGYNEELVEEISGRIPVILIHRRYKLKPNSGDFVDSDNEDGTYGLTKHLINFGHRNIFVVRGTPKATTSVDRFAGFKRAMQEIGVTVDEQYPYQYQGNFTIRSGYEAIEYMCSLPKRPTAVLALNNTMALGVLECIRSKNILVPEDLSIAAYNNIEYIELMTVRPTIHYINPRDIGLVAGRALLERLEKKELPNRELIVEGYMIPGNAVSVPSERPRSRRFFEPFATDNDR